jgi:uncharacterized protein YndB with AHSA1/START domain
MMEPVVKEMLVPVDPDAAFRRFTLELGSWWPRATHSLSQEHCADVRMDPWVGGRLYEVADDGTEQVWGSILAWSPPAGVSFTWHVGRAPDDRPQRVQVQFRAEGSGTHVRLEHGDWDIVGAEAEAMRTGYDGGWTGVLAAFAESLSGDVTAAR